MPLARSCNIPYVIKRPKLSFFSTFFKNVASNEKRLARQHPRVGLVAHVLEVFAVLIYFLECRNHLRREGLLMCSGVYVVRRNRGF